MNSLANKVQALTDALMERGDVYLFAIVERVDARDKWDLVFSSAWSNGNLKESIGFIAEKLMPTLAANELAAFSRIVILSPNEPFVTALTAIFRIEKGRAELKNNEVFGIPLRHAIIFRSKKPELKE